jgi:muramidase (phage lysozyme)
MAFLDMIAWSEGTSTSPVTKNGGYDVIVSGPEGPEIFTDYSDHPFANRQPKVVSLVPRIVSTASGRYQILFRFWHVYKQELGLKDFSPESQDAIAIQQVRECRALPMIQSGDIQGAIHACSNIWASLPGNSYGQKGGHDLAQLLNQYEILSA